MDGERLGARCRRGEVRFAHELMRRARSGAGLAGDAVGRGRRRVVRVGGLGHQVQDARGHLAQALHVGLELGEQRCVIEDQVGLGIRAEAEVARVVVEQLDDGEGQGLAFHLQGDIHLEEGPPPLHGRPGLLLGPVLAQTGDAGIGGADGGLGLAQGGEVVAAVLADEVGGGGHLGADLLAGGGRREAGGLADLGDVQRGDLLPIAVLDREDLAAEGHQGEQDRFDLAGAEGFDLLVGRVDALAHVAEQGGEVGDERWGEDLDRLRGERRVGVGGADTRRGKDGQIGDAGEESEHQRWCGGWPMSPGMSQEFYRCSGCPRSRGLQTA